MATRVNAWLRHRFQGGHGEAVTPNIHGASYTASDSRSVYPLTLHHNGKTSVAHPLYAESREAQLEWKTRLDEAIVSRRVAQDSNKVFEFETLIADTFLMPLFSGAQQQSRNQKMFTGEVTCSVPVSKFFECTDLRKLTRVESYL